MGLPEGPHTHTRLPHAPALDSRHETQSWGLLVQEAVHRTGSRARFGRQNPANVDCTEADRPKARGTTHLHRSRLHPQGGCSYAGPREQQGSVAVLAPAQCSSPHPARWDQSLAHSVHPRDSAAQPHSPAPGTPLLRQLGPSCHRTLFPSGQRAAPLPVRHRALGPPTAAGGPALKHKGAMHQAGQYRVRDQWRGGGQQTPVPTEALYQLTGALPPMPTCSNSTGGPSPL